MTAGGVAGLDLQERRFEFAPEMSKTALLVRIDNLVLTLVLVLASLPFSQVILLRGAGLSFSAFELLYGAIALALIFRVVVTGRLVYPLPLVLFAAAVFLQFGLQGVRDTPPSLHDMLYQARFYMPFGVACLFLASGTNLKPTRVLTTLCVGTIASALAALSVRYLAPGFLLSQFAASREIADLAIRHGRLHWTNASLVLFAACAAALIPRARMLTNMLIVSACSIGAIGLISTLDRTIIGGALVYISILILGDLLSTHRARAAREVAVRMALVVVMLGGMSFILLSGDRVFQSTVMLRVPISVEQARTVFRSDFAEERFPIYQKYAELPAIDYLVGQGLGRPFLIVDEIPLYTSDVSYMAFAIPFGVLGVLALATFLYGLFRRLLLTSGAGTPDSWMVTALVIVVMLVSLNVDWLSRSTAVVYLALLVMSFTHRSSHHASRAHDYAF